MAAGALARGDAVVTLRFPKPGYREKIWDHAAGAVIVTEAGAKITDAAGELSARRKYALYCSAQGKFPW